MPGDAIDEAVALLEALTGKHEAQLDATGARHASTDARNAALLRLETSVKTLARRGALKFRRDPATRAALLALMTHEDPEGETEAETAPVPAKPSEGGGA